MTNWNDMPLTEVEAKAQQTLNADDDWGYSEKVEAQQELRRRKEAIEKINYPNGRPLASLETRLAGVLNESRITGNNRFSSQDPVIRKLIAEFHRKAG